MVAAAAVSVLPRKVLVKRLRLFPRGNGGIGVEKLTCNLHFMSVVYQQIFSHRRLGAGKSLDWVPALRIWMGVGEKKQGMKK